eukprot:596846-Prymnesium_polylepis.1
MDPSREYGSQNGRREPQWLRRGVCHHATAPRERARAQRKSLFWRLHHFPSASNFRKRFSPAGSPMAGLQKAYGQRRPQTSPCRNDSQPNTGGLQTGVPFRVYARARASAPAPGLGCNQNPRRGLAFRPLAGLFLAGRTELRGLEARSGCVSVSVSSGAHRQPTRDRDSPD